MGLIETGGLFNLAKTMVLEYKVEKNKKVEVMQLDIENKSKCPVGAGA